MQGKRVEVHLRPQAYEALTRLKRWGGTSEIVSRLLIEEAPRLSREVFEVKPASVREKGPLTPDSKVKVSV